MHASLNNGPDYMAREATMGTLTTILLRKVAYSHKLDWGVKDDQIMYPACIVYSGLYPGIPLLHTD